MKKLTEYILGGARGLMPVATLAMLALAACDDKTDSDYVPGEPAPANCMTVYFDASNSVEAVFDATETPEKTITLSRKVSTEAAEVPLVCKSADAQISVPATAKFEAGQEQTSITVTAHDMETSAVYSYELSVDANYADPYADVNGSPDFSGTMVMASWNVYANVTMEWTVLDETHTWTTTLEKLGDLERYRVANFIGSGLALEFTADTQSATGKTYKVINPVKNYEAYNDGIVDGFYLYDEANDTYPVWTVGSTEVADVCFMKYYETDNYSYISFTNRYAQFGTYFADYTDGQYDYYNYVEVYWEKADEVK